MTKERIEDIRQSVIPFVKKELLEINNDGLGKSDAKEFEKDLNEVLDLASKTLEQQSDDCVSRKALMSAFPVSDSYTLEDICKTISFVPPVTPTLPKDATNGDIMKVMFPNIEADEIKTNTGGYIEVKYLDTTDKCDATAFRKNWWNAPYKRGNENE